MSNLGLFESVLFVQSGVKISTGSESTGLSRMAFLKFMLLIAALCITMASTAAAQTIDSTTVSQADSLAGGPIDTTTGGSIRPRRETFIIEAFPSPAPAGAIVTIEYYNHTPQVTMLRVVDFLDRPVATVPFPLQTKQLMQNGLHTFPISTTGLSAGMYFIRLTTYTASGDIDLVQDSRFMILH